MAGHGVYAAGAFSAVAVVLLARWCLTGRQGIQRARAVLRHAACRTAVRAARRAASTPAGAEQSPVTDAPRAQRLVQEAEELLHGYWCQLSPLYSTPSDHHQQ